MCFLFPFASFPVRAYGMMKLLPFYSVSVFQLRIFSCVYFLDLYVNITDLRIRILQYLYVNIADLRIRILQYLDVNITDLQIRILQYCM